MEVSVDEMATPTLHLECLYIALELKRLGVRWVKPDSGVMLPIDSGFSAFSGV